MRHINNNNHHDRSSGHQHPSQPSHNNRLYVGNLPYDAEEGYLLEHFQCVGPVREVRIIYDRETRQPKGYAFVSMQHEVDAQNAIRTLNGVEFCGRPLKVDQANPDKRQLAPGQARR